MLLNKYDHQIFAERLCLRTLENGDDTIGSIFLRVCRIFFDEFSRISRIGDGHNMINFLTLATNSQGKFREELIAEEY